VKITKKMRKIAKGMNHVTKLNFMNGRVEHNTNLREYGRIFNTGTPYVNPNNFNL